MRPVMDTEKCQAVKRAGLPAEGLRAAQLQIADFLNPLIAVIKVQIDRAVVFGFFQFNADPIHGQAQLPIAPVS